MKVLFANMLDSGYVRGHKKLDSRIIRYLSNISELHVLSIVDWFQELPDGIKIIIDESGQKNGHKHAYDVINQVSNLDRRYNYDYLFFESFDTYLLPFLFLKMKDVSNRVFIMHHNNIDNMEKSLKARMIFSLFGKNLNQLALDEFIGEHLKKEFDIKDSKVFSLYHPMFNALNKLNEDRLYHCVGISNSNDQNWIAQLIKIEIEGSWFKKNKIKAVFKGKDDEYDDGFLKVIKGFIPDSDYEYYYENAMMVFLPFPIDYKYRMSGTLVDAFSNRSIVIGTDIPLIDWYSKKYPSICKKVGAMNEFLEIMRTLEYKFQDSAFDEFIKLHSDSFIENYLKKILIDR